MTFNFAILVNLSLVLIGCASTGKNKWTSVQNGPEVRGIFAPQTKGEGVAILKNSRSESIWIKTLPNLSKAEALDYMQNRTQLINSVLHPSSDPYFGAIKTSPTCDSREIPQTLDENGDGFISRRLRLYATEGLVYGVCDPRSDVLRSQLLWLYCEDVRTLYEVKFFSPAKNPWPTTPMARCTSPAGKI